MGGWRRLSTQGLTWSVDFAQLAGSPVIVSGCADGKVRFQDVRRAGHASAELAGHVGAVLSVASALVEDRTLIASGGIDATVRVWNPGLRTPLISELRGHVGGVRGVSFGQMPDRTLLASAGADGTVHIWDISPSSSVSSRTPLFVLKAHSGSALAVKFGVVDGRVMLASGGDDSLVKLWDPTTGELIFEPLSGHRGGIRSVEFGIAAGKPKLASAADDGTVRIWDLGEDSPSIAPLLGHSGIVRSVKFLRVDGIDILGSAGIDGTVRFWDPSTGESIGSPLRAASGDLRSLAFGLTDQTALIAIGDATGASLAKLESVFDTQSYLAPLISRSSIVSADDINTLDVLGRSVMARHLQGVLGQFISSDGGEGESQSAVVSVDGRWGAGKTTLAELLVGVLSEETGGTSHQDLESRQSNYAESSDWQRGLRKPVVVRFDAWREAAIAPHWWAVAAAINRGVRRERSLVARLGMTFATVARRLTSSLVPLATLVTSAIAIVAVMAIRGAAPDQLNQTLEIVQTFLVGAGALFAAVAVVTRALFWASPALGRLHLRADDNPLGEVAEMVMALRRWSPRVRNNGLVETGIFIGLLAVLTLAVRLSLLLPGPARPNEGLWKWLQEYPFVIPASLIVLISMLSTYPKLLHRDRRESGSEESHSGQPKPSQGRSARSVTVWILVVFLSCGIIFLAGTLSLPEDPGRVLLLLILLGVIGTASITVFTIYSFSPHRGARRPILLIIDELDRCSSSTVVAYLETVHTVIRERQVLSPGREKWAKPAPIIVLVLADGRWVRAAFTAEYAAFKELGSPVRTLGGDFLQKLFDHTVLVPELSAEHVKNMVDLVTSSQTFNTDSRTFSDSIQNFRDENTGHGNPGLFEDIENIEETVERAASSVLAAASPHEVRRREAHLLADYVHLIPANPRLIRRVTNAWGMLAALKIHIGHNEPDDTIVRAAILWVEFPSLIDDLLSGPAAPLAPLNTEHEAPEGGLKSSWWRPDVLAVLARADGTLTSLEAIAQCYGKVFRKLDSSNLPGVRGEHLQEPSEN